MVGDITREISFCLLYTSSYDYPTRKLTYLADKKKDTEYPNWASISPDGKTVVYAKDLNLYRMSREDYEKLKKDDHLFW